MSNFFFFQAEDGIRGPLWSRGLGDVYKKQIHPRARVGKDENPPPRQSGGCLLYTPDAADDTPCVDLGGRRIIKKKI